jgi:hypothetical protein
MKEDKPEKIFQSEDMKKLGSFYNFQMDEAKFQEIQKRSKKQMMRFAFTGIAFGFLTEWLLGNSTIYSNIIKKTTLRRLSIVYYTKMLRKRRMIECNND